MKVLLINPCFDFKKFGRFQRYTESMPCLGLAYIAAVLEKNAIEVEVIDNFVLRLRKHEVLNLIKAKGPDMVGISCLTPSAPIAFSIAKSIKEYNNKILTVLGNIHADLFSEEILKNQAVDIVVHGEGEYAMLELAKAAENNTDFTYIKGISFKKDGKIVKTNFREPLKDLDRLPYPAWRLFPFKKYGFLPFADVKKPGLSILGSRGCPFRCTFCSLPNIGSNKYRKREPKNIVDEIEYLIANFPIRQIGFVDPIFPISKRDGLEFCDEMISRKLNNKIIWICETRVDKVDRELLREMRKAGCRRIVYGLESGMQASLNNIRKDFSLDNIRTGVNNTKQEGIQTVGLFMIGLPGETKEMIQQTIDFAKQIDLDFAKFAITVPFPGSLLYKDLVKTGKLKRHDWENFVTFNPSPRELVYVSGELRPEELINLQQRAHLEFYLRPKMIFRQLFKIRTVSIKDLFFGFLNLIFPWAESNKSESADSSTCFT